MALSLGAAGKPSVLHAVVMGAIVLLALAFWRPGNSDRTAHHRRRRLFGGGRRVERRTAGSTLMVSVEINVARPPTTAPSRQRCADPPHQPRWWRPDGWGGPARSRQEAGQAAPA